MWDEFVKREIIKFGDFQLSSGGRSPYYVDLRRVLAYPDLLRWVIGKYSNLLKDIEFDVIVGVATGGIPYASILGFNMFRPIAYVRESKKWYGSRREIEGAVWQGARVVVVDDVITTGESIVDAVGKLKEAGANVVAAAVFLDRQQCGAQRVERETGTQVRSAYRMGEVLEDIRDLIGPTRYREVREYLEKFKC